MNSLAYIVSQNVLLLVGWVDCRYKRLKMQVLSLKMEKAEI